MQIELYTTAYKAHRLLDYLQRIGLDIEPIAREADVDTQKLQALDRNSQIPTAFFSRLYMAAAGEMQKLHTALPWAAGIGTDSFRFLCYSIIHCNTLGEALQRSQEYYSFVSPLTRNGVKLVCEEGKASLEYIVDVNAAGDIFLPNGWDRTPHALAIAQTSGLRIWYAFMGWLTGRSPKLLHVDVASPPATARYSQILADYLGCGILYNAKCTRLVMPAAELDSKLVHDIASMEAFLEQVIYGLLRNESTPRSTSSAIRSLMGRHGPGEIPSLERMAELLHVSPSSLHRQLKAENHSYQQIKDQYRCATAISLLQDANTQIQDIADVLGFKEPGSFIRAFKKWTSVTPSAFRDDMAAFRPLN